MPNPFLALREKMVAWSILILSISSIIRPVDAIAFSTLAPTGAHRVTSIPPKPTPGWQLYRRDSFDYLEAQNAVWTGDAAVCGWLTDTIGPGFSWPVQCKDSESCVFHTPNTAFPSGAVGCCLGDNCGFITTCYDKAQIAATPTLTSINAAFARFCTESKYSECGTYTWSGAGLRNFGCSDISFFSQIYTEVIWSETDDGRETSLTLSVASADDDLLSSYSSLYDVSTSISKPIPVASSTAPTTATTTSAQPTTVNSDKPDSSDKSDSSTSAGTIAGSVFGGAAGALAIGAGVLFLVLRRRKKQRQQDHTNASDMNVNESVPEAQSLQSAWETQQAAELEGLPSPKTAQDQGIGHGNAPHELESRPFRSD